LIKINKAARWSLPIPAIFLISQEALIALAHVDSDNRDRLDPESVLGRVISTDSKG
jgi:hypothetical protein